MILQRDPRLREEIQRWGCYYMCVLWFANKWYNRMLDPTEIERIYQEVVARGWMRRNCYIERPEDLAHYVGLDARFLGHRPASYLCHPLDCEVLYFVRGKQPHFVAGDGSSHVAYDPWGASRAVAEGKMDSKRIFRRA